MNNNDKDIKEMFENIDKYEIKTSSKQIINSFNASVNENKKKPFLAPLFISFASLGIISAIVIPVVITINNSNNIIDNQDIFNPTKNKYLENQLLTFNAFKNGNNSSLMYRRSNITLEGFNKVVNEYELVHQGVKQLFEINKYKSVTVDADFEYLENHYSFESRLLNENNEIISRLYFNDINNENDNKYSMKALYYYSNNYYNAEIFVKNHTDKNKTEEEVTTLLTNVDNSIDQKCYLIEKEQEYKGIKSENSYSLKSYESYEHYMSDDDNFVSSVEYENKDTKMSVNIEKDNNEIEFENIIKKSNNVYQFDVDDFEMDDISISDITITLTYNDDSSRTYSYSEYQITKN